MKKCVTVNNNVRFNWRLIKAPMFVIDYAIVHELARLIEANHTPRFWNIVRTQAPTMDKAKAWAQGPWSVAGANHLKPCIH